MLPWQNGDAAVYYLTNSFVVVILDTMETKLCPKCGEEKTVDNFAKNKTRKDGLQCQCRTCLSAYKRASYRRNPRKKKEYVRDRYAKIRRWLNDYKSSLGCKRCGYNEHPAALQAHHVNPENKTHTISKMLTDGYSIESIQKELDKCEILCANCHLIEHFA